MFIEATHSISLSSPFASSSSSSLLQAMWYTLYMADKVPVQDKLSQILAELMWCLAGTEEDDEYPEIEPPSNTSSCDSTSVELSIANFSQKAILSLQAACNKLVESEPM